MYKVVALAGKAGSGKDTIMQRVLAAAPDRFHEIVSCTTRPMREGEVDGKNYYFLSIEEFADKINRGQMLEKTSFNNWLYGTPLSSLVEDKVNIGVFNPAGLRLLSASPQIDLSIVFIVADAKFRLIRQLNREENPDVDEIIRRYGADEEDFVGMSSEFPKASWVWNNSLPNQDGAVDFIVGEVREPDGQIHLRYTI